MTWLTWRQFRAQTIAAAAALALLAIILAATGPHLAGLYTAGGLPACHAHGDCGTMASNFISQLKNGTFYEVLFYLGLGVMFLAPAIMGVFWGAPLITREIEAGTLRLAWSQSVTRTRWLAVKLGLIGLAAMATAGLLSLMIAWWASPIDRALGMSSSSGAAAFGRIDPLMFAARGIAPVAYAAFAFALGVTAGVVIRRTLPAMAVTLAVFAVVQLAMPLWIRPHLIPPVHATVAINPAQLIGLMMSNNNTMTVIGGATEPGAWILSNQTITPAGHVFTGPPTPACLSQTNSFTACQNSLGPLHLRQVITYQPASRYWAFQWYETAIFLILALALAGFCFWRIRQRRLS